MQLAEIGVKCHNCGTRFKSRQLKRVVDSGLRNSELRLDFRGADEQFEPYSVCTCPSCGHADWATAFRRVDEATILSQPRIPAHLQYRSAALAAERSGRSFYHTGMFYLYAAWCADDDRAYPQAREYRRLAVEAFSRAIVDGSCPQAQRAEIEYVIGELLRRSGDFEGALGYFKEVIPRLPAKYAIMARRLMRLAEEGDLNPVEFTE